jgi:lipid-binding SYLF domain-containing protein
MNTSNRIFSRATFLLAGALGLMVVAACSTAPATEEGKTDLRHSSADSLTQAQQNDPSLRDVIQASAGYAVFPSIGKGAIGVGGAYGKGDVYQNGSVVGYCDMTQASIGAQLGGQDYAEILVFQNAEALSRFQNGTFSFDAQATAVAVKSGAGANAKFENGVAVFTMDEAGLMYEASVGGQSFAYQSK